LTDGSQGFVCGYAALIGRPNAGKSTLLNQILGSKLAITSSKPQTTRNRIAGIHTDEKMQVILLDTPGLHTAWTELNRQMVQAALGAISDVDVVVWLVDMTILARRAEAGEAILDKEDLSILDKLRAARRPVLLAANKMDVVPAPLVLPVIDAIRGAIELAAAVPISALTGDGVPGLMDEIRSRLPVHPALFPPDQWTQLSEKFLVSEIIREKIFHLTEQEVPYATAVEVVKFDEEERETKKIVKIYADIIVERGSQKGILIGRGGEMLKRIGTLARKEIQGLLDCRVYLELFVKVEHNWTKTSNGLKKVGFE
jgi:GTP-binding protein Era